MTYEALTCVDKRLKHDVVAVSDGVKQRVVSVLIPRVYVQPEIFG